MVRVTAVDAVIALYREPANASPLQPFKARFLQRFQELAYDVDDHVAAKGVRGAYILSIFWVSMNKRMITS